MEVDQYASYIAIVGICRENIFKLLDRLIIASELAQFADEAVETIYVRGIDGKSFRQRFDGCLMIACSAESSRGLTIGFGRFVVLAVLDISLGKSDENLR